MNSSELTCFNNGKIDLILLSIYTRGGKPFLSAGQNGPLYESQILVSKLFVGQIHVKNANLKEKWSLRGSDVARGPCVALLVYTVLLIIFTQFFLI